jgi:lipopolysaccharide export system permease protein
MRPLSTLSRYIGRQFLLSFGGMLLAVLAIILLLDVVELLRRATGKPGATFSIVVQMGLFKLPGTVQEAFPFIILFSAMLTFWRLTRSQELVVARAVGVSAWQFLAPVVSVSFLLGALQVAVLNPVGSVLVAQFEKMEDQYLRGRANSLAVGRSGLWLRQASGKETVLVHAEQVTPGTLELRRVSILEFEADDGFVGRIDAPSATLEEGYWLVRDGWYNQTDRPPERVTERRVPTDFTFRRIEESLASPDTLSFWELPRFIETLEETGFSAIRHRLHYQSLLSQPLLFCAMVLLAAAFSLRRTRRGGTLMMVGGGVVTGFALFLLSDVVLAFGLSETIPVPMAAWAPAGASLLLGIAVLLHLEDG